MLFKYLTDDQWKLIEELMHWKPEKKERGTKRSQFKKVWNSILYVLINHCRWNDIPKDPEYAHRSSAHRWLQKWEANQVLERVISGLQSKGILNSDKPMDQLLKDLKRRERRPTTALVHPVLPHIKHNEDTSYPKSS